MGLLSDVLEAVKRPFKERAKSRERGMRIYEEAARTWKRGDFRSHLGRVQKKHSRGELSTVLKEGK